LNGKINYLLRGDKENLTMELASRLEHLKINLIQDLLGTELTQFQKFQFQLGISEGGFGLKSLQHTCIAANLASKIEFLRYRLRQLPGRSSEMWSTTRLKTHTSTVLLLKCNNLELSTEIPSPILCSTIGRILRAKTTKQLVESKQPTWTG
jgi:hypothetical protein